ncbi:hypothetical protein MGG_16118 [Pyricularia oryzae 70-15]|uniref:Uncharacterized protein n=1 Tax=Pyricularia oryzae (strain 70-15 / ATCC MYA-4617 / FGSC 8958) TaxID=242507 RepID=G4MRD9_PYRO7|nr:uncharacterized protein MGG_16118 [Pyricularia oryzae 70-15]EHA56566.1 hypothetical protein MGG_16118 [Pyricularia oryzae 70-15]KAI7916227.1 hypothetical protein M0657_008685 [Pyricularia oryzae]KAI7920672.1 hypothetical protein M9X92_005757 [Pyricularia oryzae]
MADKTDTRLAGLTEDDVDLHPSKLCKPWCDSMCIPPLSIVSFRKTCAAACHRYIRTSAVMPYGN